MDLSSAPLTYSSRELTFSWSPVAPDCPAIHYNILASNCGSCPTTTNHTTVTCTDVPANDSVCTFAVQTVVCGNITGDTSGPISIILYTTEPTISTSTGTIHPTGNQATHNSDTTETAGMYKSVINTVYTISFSSATALIVSISGLHNSDSGYAKKEKSKDYSCIRTIKQSRRYRTQRTNVRKCHWSFTFN